MLKTLNASCPPVDTFFYLTDAGALAQNDLSVDFYTFSINPAASRRAGLASDG